MKKHAIATIFVSTILLASGITACNQDPAPKPSTPPVSNPTTPAPVSSSPAIAPSATPSSSPSTTPKTDKAKIEERAKKREERLKQIEAVLTPEQVEKLKAKLKNGEKLQKSLDSLDLNPEQKAKVKKIFDNFSKILNASPSPTPSAIPNPAPTKS